MLAEVAMPVAVRAMSTKTIETLTDGWQVCTVAPRCQPEPSSWVPTTHPTATDDHVDHWFRRTVHISDLAEDRVGVPTSGALPNKLVHLVFEGIATIADVWWNGELIATSTSMFTPIRVDITDRINHTNQLVVHCRSLQTHLATIKFGRARWKTRLVVDQRLRGVRTTLLGHIPSWAPPTVVVGAWRPIRIEVTSHGDVTSVHAVNTSQTLKLLVTLGTGFAPVHYRGSASVGDATAPFSIEGDQLVAKIATEELAKWFPHTHGTPTLHRVAINLLTDDHRAISIDLGLTGIRDLAIDRGPDGKGFGVVINGAPIFCRGGSLMPLNVTTLDDDPQKLRDLLELLQRSGVNMVRISGTTVPASTILFDLCDELGILVWHDLTLANFDYPSSEGFVADLIAETAAWCDRASLSPSLVVVCGGSEIEQQAAMTGLGLDRVSEMPLLEALETFIHAHRPDLAFVRSSPTAGHLPFAIDQGVSHYFGVGAYRRPLSDARTSGVRFASECLAFANVPSQQQVVSLLGDSRKAPTDPRWKERVPRDRGVGWDFDDVRDHYTRILFGVDPLDARYTSPDWYLTLARATSAELMKRTFAEWRRGSSSCTGALVWFLNDLWAGAGWGVIDSTGEPKAALHGMAQALTPVALLAVDEGLNGLDFWVCNDLPVALEATLSLTALQDGRSVVMSSQLSVEVPANAHLLVRTDSVFGQFTDATRAYRFGAPSFDVVVGHLSRPDGSSLAAASYVCGTPLVQLPDLGVQVKGHWIGPSTLELEIASERFSRLVDIEIAGARVWPNMFDVCPGRNAFITAEFGTGVVPSHGYATPVNARSPFSFSIPRRLP